MRLDSAAFLASSVLLEVLSEHATPVDCRQQRTLFRQGETPTGLYILLEGHAYMTLSAEDGTEILCTRIDPGSLLGLPGLIGNEAYSLGATAEAQARVCFLAREDFEALMRTDPKIAMKILQILAAEVRTARQAISA